MKPVIILTIVGFCSAFLLSIVNESTKSYILAAQKKEKINALAKIFPFELKKVEIIPEENTTFYEINDSADELQGVGVEASTEKGYGGKINILLAISPDCKIFNYSVLTHQETPGLGDKISNENFKKQFSKKTLNKFVWKVKRDGGFVDELTAATISTRAVTEAIHNGLKMFSNKYPGRCR